jgi:hypothetical protein
MSQETPKGWGEIEADAVTPEGWEAIEADDWRDPMMADAIDGAVYEAMLLQAIAAPEGEEETL